MFISKKKILSSVSNKKENCRARHHKKILNEVKNTENIFAIYMIEKTLDI